MNKNTKHPVMTSGGAEKSNEERWYHRWVKFHATDKGSRIANIYVKLKSASVIVTGMIQHNIFTKILKSRTESFGINPDGNLVRS